MLPMDCRDGTKVQCEKNCDCVRSDHLAKRRAEIGIQELGRCMHRSESICLDGRSSYGILPFFCAMFCLLSSGCGLGEWARNGFKVGPNYKTPPAPIASQWID